MPIVAVVIQIAWLDDELLVEFPLSVELVEFGVVFPPDVLPPDVLPPDVLSPEPPDVGLFTVDPEPGFTT